ncbi:uncharacterized protein LOC131019566 [Salvia miltiorrhiza]|uniref:uncharacterized protein LOC131019566 n=1 Tax=Salvia miltiorrhiza TaxID=226208 RepID=UPI0025ACF813|nr:uncharacterized protein LOC131019566 [Salvia miltiorrhiza]
MERGKGKQAFARRKEPDEKVEKLKKKRKIELRRRQRTLKCKKCGVEGHNSVTCGRDEVMNNLPSGSERATGESSGSILTQVCSASMRPPQISHTDEQDDQMEHIEISTQVSQSKAASVPGPSMLQQLYQGKFQNQGQLILQSGKKFGSLAELQTKKK